MCYNFGMVKKKLNSIKLLSIVVPCYNEEEVLPLFYDEINKLTCAMEYINFEFIFVDDGSRDDTLSIIKKYRKTDKRVRYTSFSRNFGKEAAMLAGLKSSRGDYVVIIDADLQHPPQLIEEMYKVMTKEKCDCVGALKVNYGREKFFRKVFTKGYYKLINSISKTKIRKGERDFRLMTRQVVNSILSLPEYNRYSLGIYGYVGYNIKWIEYQNVDRIAGESKWSFNNLVSYALSGISSLSVMPLLVSSFLGFILLIMSILLCIFCFIIGFVNSKIFLISLILLFSSIQLLVFGIIGQYLSKIYLEVRDRPIYIIQETEKYLN